MEGLKQRNVSVASPADLVEVRCARALEPVASARFICSALSALLQVGKVHQPDDDKHHAAPGGAALFCKLLTVRPC